MRNIIFDIDRGKISANISLDFSEISEKYSLLLMLNFTKYFNRTLGVGCLRIFITDYELKLDEFKLGINPEKDKKALKALGILIFRINKNLSNWLELTNDEKLNFVKELWLLFFTELPQIVFNEDKCEVIKKFNQIHIE